MKKNEIVLFESKDGEVDKEVAYAKFAYTTEIMKRVSNSLDAEQVLDVA